VPSPRCSTSLRDLSPSLKDDGNLDRSTANAAARSELLRQSVFPVWKDGVAGADHLDNPEKMHQEDPLLTQIWRLYRKTKAELPNQERMENLSWRLMAMNLKRKEREQAQYVSTRVKMKKCSSSL
jgi:GATA-binding protein